MADIQPYMKDCYKKEFTATVKSITEGKFVVLSKTYFYPVSGGQPHDTGILRKSDGSEVNVLYVGKFNGDISHQIDPEHGLVVGDEVTGIIDWDRRFLHMRMHTAAHLITYVFEHKKDAVVTGNQLGDEKSRIDYQLDDYDPEELRGFQADVQELIDANLPVVSHFLSKEEAMKKTDRLSTLAAGFPDDVKEIRLLEVGDIDIQACGGTHLKNTSEVGTVKFIKFANKGKNNRRLYFELE